MVERIENRPAGGREGDFSELGDWTITEIATAPKTSPEDRKNAKAEIARREAAGIYNLDESPREVRSDLLSHGYGVENGKVLYPKPEYKSWLESDRKEPMPSGIKRESIEDRLEAERQEAAKAREAMFAERRREFDRAAGEAAIRAYEDAPVREKIYHPSRKSAKKREVVNQPSERVRSPESVEAKAEKLYNYYDENFSKNVPRWASFGVSSLLEKGIVDPPTDSLLRSGFWAREQDRIHGRIDPEDSLSIEASDAESDLKVRVSRDLIGEKAKTVSNEDLLSAKRDGLLYAISSGARVDNHNGKIVYSIPFEQSNEVVDFMKKVGVNLDDFDEEDRDRKIITASYQGFSNIIEAIKNNDKETEKGFKALDWYFDNFNYKERISDFLGVMDAFQENADNEWKTKLEEYLSTREEVEKYLKQLEQKPIPQLTQVEEISEEELIKMYEDLVKNIAQQPATLRLFPDIERYPIYNHTGAVLPVNMPPTSVQKLGAIVSEFAKIKVFDPNANVYKGVFQDSNKRNKNYMIIRYGMRNSNVAIAAPIESFSNDASYVWVGQTGNNRDGWKDAFVQNPDPTIPTSKYQAHHRDDVTVHNHIAAMKTRGLNATENMWYNIYKSVDKRAV
ncbi:hypothetical protein J6V85_03560 [Candidatus Saccharibacteria bacterium]|nr:hypothetical protein [Candidatus Saccharibacteria bacterium]